MTIEVPLDLSAATLTSSGCTHPEKAVDNDPATSALFGPPDALDEAWTPVVNTNPQAAHTHSAYFAVTAATLLPRFMKVEWGDDRFITRIRVKATGTPQSGGLTGGDGLSNAGVSLLSSLGFIEQGEVGDPPEIPLLLPPFPGDDGFYILDFDLPFLASGVVFHPDALLSSAELALLHYGDYPTLLLSQLDVFESVEEGQPIMSAPTTERSRIGVQGVSLYPWNGAAGPYDATKRCALHGLGELGFDSAIKTAMVQGGETTHPLGGHETERITKVKVTSAVSSLLAIQILKGGTLAVDPAAGNLGEVQYFKENLGDRAPYFRLEALSTVGDGTDSFTYFKCKVEGTISYSLAKDKVTDLTFEFVIYWDTTALLKDGSTGGILEWLYGALGETARHS